MKEVVVAILAKDKAYCLPFYLECLLYQTYPKDKIHLYIRTNDNKDNTASILSVFLKAYGHQYASVHFDDSPIDKSLSEYKEHEWNSHRFSILGKIRQESIDYAIQLNADYYVIDCDNFVVPNSLAEMQKISDLGICGPMLRLSDSHYYSNFHNLSCPNGYYQQNSEYFPILSRNIIGLIEVSTIHCTYYIANRYLKEVTYNDGSGRYEYAIFSENLRNKNIPQYLDNRVFYGFLFLNDQIEMPFASFIRKYWLKEYSWMSKNNS